MGLSLSTEGETFCGSCGRKMPNYLSNLHIEQLPDGRLRITDEQRGTVFHECPQAEDQAEGHAATSTSA